MTSPLLPAASFLAVVGLGVLLLSPTEPAVTVSPVDPLLVNSCVDDPVPFRATLQRERPIDEAPSDDGPAAVPEGNMAPPKPVQTRLWCDADHLRAAIDALATVAIDGGWGQSFRIGAPTVDGGLMVDWPDDHDSLATVWVHSDVVGPLDRNKHCRAYDDEPLVDLESPFDDVPSIDATDTPEDTGT